MVALVKISSHHPETNVTVSTEKTATIEWFFKERSPLLSNDIGLLKFFGQHQFQLL
jgi:hypothetical protein